jgi:hypothetical protein
MGWKHLSLIDHTKAYQPEAVRACSTIRDPHMLGDVSTRHPELLIHKIDIHLQEV